jgi:hypothetical protein
MAGDDAPRPHLRHPEFEVGKDTGLRVISVEVHSVNGGIVEPLGRLADVSFRRYPRPPCLTDTSNAAAMHAECWSSLTFDMSLYPSAWHHRSTM